MDAINPTLELCKVSQRKPIDNLIENTAF